MKNSSMIYSGAAVLNRPLFDDLIGNEVRTVAVFGHVRPDGDSMGSVLAVFEYLKTIRPELEVKAYLESFDESFRILSDSDRLLPMEELKPDQVFDLCISVDVSDPDRLGAAKEVYFKAAEKICIDHHITNTGFGDFNYIRGGLSSCAEALLELFDLDKVSCACAESLYLGIVHDTGVFKYSSTSEATLGYVGKLVSKGVRTTDIIDSTFFAQTFTQKKILGIALAKMEEHAGGRVITTVLSLADLNSCHATKADTSAVPDNLRTITGVEACIFACETAKDDYKFSMRSNKIVDVATIAAKRQGGGHVRAAGFSMQGNVDDMISRLIEEMEEQLSANS